MKESDVQLARDLACLLIARRLNISLNTARKRFRGAPAQCYVVMAAAFRRLEDEARTGSGVQTGYILMEATASHGRQTARNGEPGGTRSAVDDQTPLF